MNGAATLNWLEDFRSFTVFHLVTVVVFGGLIAAACSMGRLWRGSERERRLRVGWAWFVVVFAVVSNGWYLLPENYDLGESLPLHVCDLAVFLAAVALLTRNRLARTMLYFWGIGLSTQAFATPTLGWGVAHARFWWFWVGHTAIVGSAVYDVIVGGYRPRVKDLWIAIGLSFLYVLAMMALDVWIGANYGYVGDTKPSTPTIIDRLGPWPLRVVYLSLIVIADFVVLWGVWPVARRVLGRDPIVIMCPACGAVVDAANGCRACGAAVDTPH